MAYITVQAILPMSSGVPADAITNTWHMRIGGAAGPVSDVIDALMAFYQALKNQYSADVGVQWNFKVYNTGAPAPNYPVVEDTRTWTGSTGTGSLPHEVAVVCSFQGARVSGEEQARKRGRVYIGPLASAVSATSGRPSTTFLNNAETALVNLATDLVAADYPLSIWSPTNGSGVDAVDAWIDNAFDTQRRRGREATVRNAFSL